MGSMTLRRSSRRSPDRRAVTKGQVVVADARESAARAAESTRDWAAPKVEAARDWAGPKVEPTVTKVKDDVLPKVAGAVAAAVAASEPVREEARTRGTAAVAALRGELEPPKPKTHRVRNFFLVSSLVGAAAAAWKAWTARTSNQPDPWAAPISTGGGGAATSSSSVGGTATGDPTAGVTPGDIGASAGTTTAGPTLVTDDAAGASPDEAMADTAIESANLSDDTPSAAPGAATTEKVTSKQSKKVKDVAAESDGGEGSSSS